MGWQLSGSPIAVIGGGIGGLTTAIALRTQGFEVLVHESAPELLEVGAGIWVQPNAMQILDRLGLADEVRVAGYPVDRIELADRRAGVLKRIDLGKLTARYGHPIIGIERAALQRVLVEALGEDSLRLGHEFIEYLEDAEDSGAPEDAGSAGGTGGAEGAVRARFRLRGEEDLIEGGHADALVVSHALPLLIGADGLHSRVRQQLFPGSTPRYSGQSSYRALASVELPPELQWTSREIWGEGCRFGFSAVGRGRVSWYASWEAPPGEEDRPGERGDRLAWFAARFPDPVPAIIEATLEDEVVRTDISDLRPLRRWHRGRVVLLGDAAHATTPNLGQGGAQAIEDGYALAMALAEDEELGGVGTRTTGSAMPRLGAVGHETMARGAGEREEVGRKTMALGQRDPGVALRRYERWRRRKAVRVVRRSRIMGKVGHWRQPIARWVRNVGLRLTPASMIRRQLQGIYDLGY